MTEKEPINHEEKYIVYISRAVQLLIVLAVATNAGHRVYEDFKGRPTIEILQTLLQPEE